MPRIRTIKPEFWQCSDMADVSDKAKLLALGLLNQADDEGYFQSHPALIKAAIFPFSDSSVNIHTLLTELSNINYIELFTGGNGKVYGLIINFLKHQKINRPSPSHIKDLRLITEGSVNTQGDLTVGKERKGKERNRERNRERIKKKSTDLTCFQEKGYDLKVINLLIEHRQGLKKPLDTDRKIQGLLDDLQTYATHWSITPDAAVDFYLQQSWISIDPEYKYTGRPLMPHSPTSSLTHKDVGVIIQQEKKRLASGGNGPASAIIKSLTKQMAV